MKIGEKKFVTLSYTLTVDGSVADSATAENPLGFVFGAGYLLPEFEKNIDGLSAGEKFEFTLTPENGYGLPNPDMVIELPRSTFEVDGQVEEGLLTVGNQIPMMTNDGMRLIGVVASVDGDKVKMDFNHPMAGKTLNFAGEIVGVREATDEDYPHAHNGGCSCGCSGDGCDDCQRRSLLLTECFRVFGFSAQRPALGRIRLWQRVRTVFPNAEHCVRCGFRWDDYGMRYERGRISGGRFGLPDAAGRGDSGGTGRVASARSGGGALRFRSERLRYTVHPRTVCPLSAACRRGSATPRRRIAGN